jgi:hypothetical protein
MNLFGASWKPKVVAILALVGPGGLWFLLNAFGVNPDRATSISSAVFAVLACFGLYTAKQDGVSNSPTPLAVGQPVVPVTQPIPSAAPVALAHPVLVASTPMPAVSDKSKVRL